MAESNEKERVRARSSLGLIDYRSLVESVRDYAIFMLDPTGVVVSWNAGAQQINGYTADEIIGRDFRVFYLPEDRDSGRPELELETAERAGRFEDEGWRIRKDGSRFRASVIVTALRGPTGKLNGFAKITRDVTERWEAEQELRLSEERFRILVDQIRDYAIYLMSPEGLITTWNLGAKLIKGYEAKEVIGRSFSMFYTPEDIAQGRFGKLLRQAEDAGTAREIGCRVRKDGTRFWADVTLTALRDSNGDLYGFTKVARDLTDQVEIEELEKAYKAAQEAVRVRDEFLSIASHELRTPLAAMQLQLQVALRQLDDGFMDKEPESFVVGLDRALSSAKRLSQLVDTLLDVTRITTDRIQLHPSDFDMAEMVREEVGRLAEIAKEAGCELHVQAETGIEGRWDRLRIEQALMNLVSNACKYAPGSPVWIGVERDAEHVRLWVRDQGPGIDADSLEKVFERFAQAGAANKDSGLGLGLFVTQQIARAHGGNASVASKLGEGCLFTIELPLQTVSSEELM